MFSNRQMRALQTMKIQNIIDIFSRHTQKYDARFHSCSFCAIAYCSFLESTNNGPHSGVS